MTVRSFILLSASLLLGLVTANAQDYLFATGSPVFSTNLPIDQGFVNVNNGEIHLEIPLATKAQRGGSLALNERLIYDSRIWKIVQNGSLQWQPTNVPNSTGGWFFSSGLGSGSITFQNFGGSDPNSPACAGTTIPSSQDYNNFANWVWTDASGTSHSFPDASTIQYLPPTDANCTGSSPADTPNSVGIATDGSGYVLQVTNYTDATITGPDGIAYHPTLSANSGTQNIVDRNGNFWSADGNGNLIDTSGVAPILISTNGNQTFYDVLAVGGGRQRYTVTTAVVIFHTGFNESAVGELTGSFNAIQSIQLPDGSQYSFTYDSGSTGVHYGEMTSMTLPTGGVINFTYVNYKDSFNNQNEWINSISKDGGTTTFVPAVISQCSSSAGCQEKITVTHPDGNDTVYTFTLDKAGQIAGSSWVQSIASYQGPAGGTLLRSTTTNFTYTTSSPSRFINGVPTPVGTYQIPATLANIVTLDTGQSSQTVTALRNSPGPSEVKVWDFGSNFSGAPTTDTLYTYTSFGSASPTSVIVYDGASSANHPISRVMYGYDETSPSTTSQLPNHTSVSNARGNLTSQHEWINTSGATYDTTMTYDDAGTLLSTTDPNGKTTFGYDSTDTYVTNTVLPTPSSGIGLQTFASYDSGTGVITSSTDQNGVQTIYTDFDSLNRPKTVNIQASGVLVGKSTFNYTPNQTSTIVFQSASTSSDTETQFDAYGRLSRVAKSNGQSSNPWYQNDVCYNPNGDVVFRSYPYQANGFNTPKVCQGVSAGDAFIYDGLGRTKSITHADQSSIQFSYRGNATQVVDESGVSRITQIDGFGRQVIVCELSATTTMPGSGAPENCGTDLSGSGFVTRYSYGLASHTTTVVQGMQTRTFQSDSLGRSILVSEPERGQTSYSYAYNGTGLVVTRQRPQANQTNPAVLTTTTYQYDALGRIAKKSYSDGEGPAIFVYDIPSATFSTVPANAPLKVVAALANTKGRLAVACKEPAAQNSCIAQDALSYDSNGDVISKWSSTPNYISSGSPVRFQAFSYDWLGNILSADDGGGVTTSYSYSVANEINSITSSRNDATHSGTLVTTVQNGPNGPLSWQYGNGLFRANQYDLLGRQTGSFDCVNSSQINCTGGTVKNGYFRILQGQRVTEVCTGPCANYGYDEFNRVISRTETSGTQNQYTYVYDRYGNRWQQNALSGGFSPSISFDVSTNHIATAGYTYDAAGNLTSDGTNNYSYDAEGNLIQEIAPSNTTTFTYDAFNRQVRSDFVSFGSATENIFTPTGQIASLWFGTGSNNSLIMGKAYWGGTPIESYIVSRNMAFFQSHDGIGSISLVMDAQGNVTGQRTYLPFGDGLTVNIGSRDNSFDGFAGMWDGGASSSNHAQFREYSNSQGRWLAPDPYDGSYDLGNPQSLNRYTYVLNSPLLYADPTGRNGCTSPAFVDPTTLAVSCIGTGIGSVACGPLCGEIIGDIVGAVAGTIEAVFGFGKPQFHGTLKPRPQPPIKNPCANSTLAAAGVDAKQQIATAQSYILNSAGPFGSYTSYFDVVRTGGPNDIKNLPGHSPQNPIDVAAGNISYGITCPFGAIFCQTAAGFAQGGAGLLNEISGGRYGHGAPGPARTFFDSPSDNAQIKIGQKLRAAGCHE